MNLKDVYGSKVDVYFCTNEDRKVRNMSVEKYRDTGCRHLSWLMSSFCKPLFFSYQRRHDLHMTEKEEQ